MKIGDRVLLHNVAFPHTSRKGDAPDRLVLVTVVETKQVPNTWGPGFGEGYRAFGEDGRYYLCNWTHFPDDSTCPTWSWTREMPLAEIQQAVKDNDAIWYDITKGLQSHVPFVPVWLEQYKHVVKYCSIHQSLDYDECFYCKHAPELGIPEKDYSWLGWK